MAIRKSSSFNLKSKIHKAVSIALISAGFIPAVNAVETNVNINNPTGTTIADDPTAVNLNNGASFTVNNDGSITGNGTTNIFGVKAITTTTISSLTNSGTISGTASGANGRGVNITVNSVLTALTNSGTISGTSGTNVGLGIKIDTSTANSIINSVTGTISGSADGVNGIGIYVDDTATLTTLTNDGTISGTSVGNVGHGILLKSTSVITNFTNTGTISGTSGGNNGAGVYVDTSTLTTLTNSGTLSGSAATNGVGVAVDDGGTLTTLTNTGTITGTSTGAGAYAVVVDDSSTLTTLTNSGTITGTATGAEGYGVFLQETSTLTTLTNTGTISGSDSSDTIGIKVDATSGLTTLNNLQSDLTYDLRLPQNYRTIIRNSDNYGKTTFSNPAEHAGGDTVYTPFAGSTDTAVYIKEGTYSSVMTGMPDANLSDTVTGTLTGDGENSVGNATWTLSENGTNVWDLSVLGDYAFVDRANTQLAFNQLASNIGEVFQNMTAGGNFAHMMTYDCNSFGNGGCVSFGGRITNSGGNDHSGTLVLGKKFSDNFRLSGFIDQSIDHNSYSNIEVDSNVPLVGLTGVWNKDADNQGLQIKVGNTYQSNDTDITRAIVGTSESAKGDTTVETQSYIAEASYQITDTVSSARPFIAVRYMQTEMDGYTETGAAAPARYQDMSEESYVAIAGVKTSKKISPDVTLNFGYGIETDLDHSDAQLQGRVIGISAFSASAISSDPENSTRQMASIGADFNLAGGQIGVKGLYQELRYRKDDATTVHVSYTLPF
ncbi:autotransporter outer membrane beta-barrel domain-containing protein [Pelagibacteraceae bacterium]|nr:autotransporter outer membrane beta-barrel domain-containing protein [Pelagibacteraceae bacterium]